MSRQTNEKKKKVKMSFIHGNLCGGGRPCVGLFFIVNFKQV